MNGWFYEPAEQALWFNSDKEWTQHSMIPLHSQTWTFHRQGEKLEAPGTNLQQAMVQLQGTKVSLTRSGIIEQAIERPDAVTHLQTQQFYHMWHWEVVVVGNLPKMLEDISVWKGYAVSDGLFQLGKGAAAWIIEGRDNTNRISGMCLSPSNDNGHSSFAVNWQAYMLSCLHCTIWSQTQKQSQAFK